MNPDRWHKISQIFHGALGEDADERAAFLARACEGDDALRGEVESLLADQRTAEVFLATTALEMRQGVRDAVSGALFTGQQIGTYQILSRLGAGGMGEVYRAHDRKLNREVALKILPAPFASDPDRFARFQREAQVLASLNHPNIATIHELREEEGVTFIVMEYVEGDTLKAKVARGPLPASEIVTLATEIAEALDATHSIGIIHRDVKSANIMITARGHAKVLDFGLAMRQLPHHPLSRESTTPETLSRLVMGTVPYMSPEQALGRKIDPRSDLFSLGVVLYEMATGRLPFSGSTPPEVMANIIHNDPHPIRSINPTIPAGLELVIVRCLEKLADERIQTAAELARNLRMSESDTQSLGRADRVNNNLPQQLTRFIGRASELAEIHHALKHTRLLTLSGPGGIGKTRLALQVAADSLGDYNDGVWFVEFASLTNAGLVPQTVASTLGAREKSGLSITETVTNFVKHRHLLLVLDNCEHVIGACARLTDLLLRASQNLRVLATSRESLGITGESVFRVPALGLPDPRRLPDLASLSKHEAVELFVDRARSVKSSFAISSSNALPLAKLCVQLEGIPLAIELAASRVRVLSMAQIAARLQDRLGLLTGGSRTSLPRH